MQAVLIIIGDEILSGNTIDTNSNFMAAQLKEIGIPVKQILTVADDVESIKSALKLGFEMGNLVISTGGLGPTNDDVTKKAFKEFFNDEIIFHQETYDHLERLFIKRKRTRLLDLNRSQAEVLSKAVIFQNDNGTAPGQMVSENGKTAIFLPGVPYEMKPLFSHKVIPWLKQNYSLGSLLTRVVSVVGIPESLLSDTIQQWENELPDHLSLSYLPIGNRIKLRISGSSDDKIQLENVLEEQVQKLKPYITGHILSFNGNEIQDIVKEILLTKNLTISSAESCTGGGIARLLTSCSGSSGYFSGGIIAYDARKKIEILGVSENTIREKTTVSQETAQEMSLGCQKLFKTDIAVATTGVAGPSSDEFGNEVGMVFYSIRIDENEYTRKLFLPHLDRNDFMNFVSQRVLQELAELLVHPEKREE